MVLDRAVSGEGPDIMAAASSLFANLVATAPRGCEVVGIAPRPSSGESRRTNGPSEVWHAAVPRRELAAAWRAGASLGAAGGMIHSPTLMAPLVRHDRAHDHDQTVVTLWSLEAWTAPERLGRGEVAWQRAMLKRAVRFADAVVVPSHAMAEELADIAPLGARIRVIAGAPSAGVHRAVNGLISTPRLGLPERYVAVVGHVLDLANAFRAVAGLDLGVVVLGDGAADPARIFELAREHGISEDRLRAPHLPQASQRADVLANARAVVAPSGSSAFPWRALEALAAGAPLIAVRNPQNEELLADGAVLVASNDEDGLTHAVQRATGDAQTAERMRLLARDRSHAFCWRDAAERVWQLHSEL